MERRRLRIQLTGPSGMGKTTLAMDLARHLGIEFSSGSYSDLMPETRKMTHREMLELSPETKFQNDYQLLNLRNKLWNGKSTYVSDRSFMDSAAYMVNKVSQTIPECDLDSFVGACKTCLTHCEAVIFLTYPDKIHDWSIEDNHKRILNGYYQMQISQIIWGLLRDMDWHFISNEDGGIYSTIQIGDYVIPVCIVKTTDYRERLRLVGGFLHKFDLLTNTDTLFSLD
jgi:hypothetical protein|uniref:AAA domain protein n=1 Tax=Myoviridae sp. ctx322 TaxID=2826711 RepID=A0A8S5NB50_9CAUD|nr:MAG TPA: AAA domain protein [Myoviridae sp. ctx322]